MAGAPPGKTLTFGLDWHQSYVDLAKKAGDDVKRAHEIIKEKLPLLGQLQGVISLTFGDRQAIFLDARSEDAKLVDEFEGEPTTSLNMKPECEPANLQ